MYICNCEIIREVWYNYQYETEPSSGGDIEQNKLISLKILSRIDNIHALLMDHHVYQSVSVISSLEIDHDDRYLAE